MKWKRLKSGYIAHTSRWNAVIYPAQWRDGNKRLYVWRAWPNGNHVDGWAMSLGSAKESAEKTRPAPENGAEPEGHNDAG